MVTTVPATMRRFLLPFVRHFRAKGWEVFGAANGISGAGEMVEEFDRVFEIPWTRRPLAKDSARAVAACRELLNAERFDLVHTHTPVASFLMRFAAATIPAKKRPKVIYTAHGFHFHPMGSHLGNAVYLAAERLAGRVTDYLVVLNHHDYRAARKYRIVPKDRVMYMPGIGIDLSEFNPGQSRRKEEPEGGPDDVIFLMIGEFNPGKRHRDLLHALALIRDESKATVVFAGSGPELESMKRLAEELRVQDRVRFLGIRDDIPDLIAASRAVVLPSEREGLPRCLLESLAMGVPVIASRIRGHVDLLGDGQAGLLVDVGDCVGLAAAMRRLETDPDLARSMGRSGLSAVRQYEINNVIEHHERLYCNALKGLPV